MPIRSLNECREFLKMGDAASLADDEIIKLLESKDIKVHDIEKVLVNHLRSVEVRRKYLLKQNHMKHMRSMQDLPYKISRFSVLQ